MQGLKGRFTRNQGCHDPPTTFSFQLSLPILGLKQQNVRCEQEILRSLSNRHYRMFNQQFEKHLDHVTCNLNIKSAELKPNFMFVWKQLRASDWHRLLLIFCCNPRYQRVYAWNEKNNGSVQKGSSPNCNFDDLWWIWLCPLFAHKPRTTICCSENGNSWDLP